MHLIIYLYTEMLEKGILKYLFKFFFTGKGICKFDKVHLILLNHLCVPKKKKKKTKKCTKNPKCK